MSALKNIAIVGATGGLGQEIARLSASKGYAVTAVVRDLAKATEMFGTTSAVKIAVANIETGEGLDAAFNGVDVVVEVISNSQRPNGIQTIVSKCESNNIQVFVACGGAGQLFTTPDRSDRVVSYLEKMPNMGWARPVTNLHMSVQAIAYGSNIPMVMQICPPGMSSGAFTNSYSPIKDISGGVGSASYQDVAAALLDALGDASTYNRAMVGLAPKPAEL